MLPDAVSHACPPALTSSSSPLPLTRNGTSTSSAGPPTERVSRRGEMIAGFGGASIVAPAVTGKLSSAGRRSGSGSRLPERPVEIERGPHPELEAVAVRVGAVEGDADAVVRRALPRDPRREPPAHRNREIAPGGVADGHVIEPGMAGRRRLGAAALPGVWGQGGG